MTLAAIIFALQMMIGTTPTPTQISASVSAYQASGIIVVTDSQEGF